MDLEIVLPTLYRNVSKAHLNGLEVLFVVGYQSAIIDIAALMEIDLDELLNQYFVKPLDEDDKET